MKVSDYMLDLNTGDASFTDAFIVESVGQIDIACQEYDIMNQIYDADILLNEAVQEAAFGKVMANTIMEQKQVAAYFGNQAVEQVVASFIKLLKSAATDTTLSSDATKLIAHDCTAINGTLTFDKGTVISAKAAEKIADAYTEAMAKFVSALGLSIDGVFDSEVVRSISSCKGCNDDPDNVKDMSNYIKRGVVLLKGAFRTVGADSSFKSSVSKDDVCTIKESIECIGTVSKAVTKTLGPKNVKKSVISMLREFCSDESDSRNNSKAIDALLNNIKEASDIISEVSKCIKTQVIRDTAARLTVQLKKEAKKVK